MHSPLSALSAIISSGVADIESAYAAQGATYPSLDEPFRPDPMDAMVQEAANLVIAAAGQLIATIRPAPVSILNIATGVGVRLFLISSQCFRSLDAFFGCPWYCERSQHLRGLKGLWPSGISTTKL